MDTVPAQTTGKKGWHWGFSLDYLLTDKIPATFLGGIKLVISGTYQIPRSIVFIRR